MTRRDVFLVLAAVTAIAAASWVVNTVAWLAWIILAGALLFVIVGTIVLAGTSRREGASPHPARGRSPLSTGGLGRTSVPGGSRRARTVSGSAPKTTPSRTGPWL